MSALPTFEIPWGAIGSPDLATALVIELHRELGPGHVLYGKKVQAIACRQDCDDVLFLIDGAEACAVVHLTYSQRPEPDPAWPIGPRSA